MLLLVYVYCGERDAAQSSNRDLATATIRFSKKFLCTVAGGQGMLKTLYAGTLLLQL